jgi:hypothetical protein
MPTKKNMKKINTEKFDAELFDHKMTPNNALKILKNSNVKGNIYGLLMLTIFNIVFISSIIFYLNTLKDCKCFEEKNVDNYSNLNYLITIESIVLALNIILTLGCIFVILAINDLKSGGGENKAILSYYIIFIIYILLYGYFMYYVYKLYQNVDENCDCTQSWLRYLLYFQIIFMIIQIIMVIFSAVM